jgi:hypothetical protein
MDHHGAEIGPVDHQVACQRQRHALVPAQLGVGRGEPLAPHGGGRIHHLEPGEVQAEGGRPAVHRRLVAEDGEIDHAAPQQLPGRLQDPVVAAFRQHDVLAVGLGPLGQLLLELERRHPCRWGHRDAALQRRDVHVLLEQRQRPGDLQLAVGA